MPVPGTGREFFVEGMMMAKVLLHGDVDAIKDFVFETHSLPQIRGGSELLLECEKKVKTLVKGAGGREVYCSGGSFLFWVPAEKAQELKEQIERLYLRETRMATVTVVLEEAKATSAASSPAGKWAERLLEAYAPAQKAGDFAHRVAFLAARLREAKTSKELLPFEEALPFGRRCQACGRRMAQEMVPRREPEEPEVVEYQALCSVCVRRLEKGRKARGEFNTEFSKHFQVRAKLSPDLDHLVKESPRKYVAFIYADGNDIGKLLQQVQREEEFEALSKALTEGTAEALYQALWNVCGDVLQRDDSYWPFEIINIGGDDITLLIQAGYAWEVAVEFLERFEAEVRRRVENELKSWPQSWPAKITASCGIAIADVRYPVRYLERLAEELLKDAKKVAKASTQNPQSALTFLWMPTPVAVEEVGSLMERYIRDERELTLRPYTLEQARKLHECVRSFFEKPTIPRTLRHRWAEALDKGVYVSVNTIHYDIARRREEERELLYQKILRTGELMGLSGTPSEPPAPIWRTNGRKWRTALLDVLELAELYSLRPEASEGEE